MKIKRVKYCPIKQYLKDIKYPVVIITVAVNLIIYMTLYLTIINPRLNELSASNSLNNNGTNEEAGNAEDDFDVDSLVEQRVAKAVEDMQKEMDQKAKEEAEKKTEEEARNAYIAPARTVAKTVTLPNNKIKEDDIPKPTSSKRYANGNIKVPDGGCPSGYATMNPRLEKSCI